MAHSSRVSRNQKKRPSRDTRRRRRSRSRSRVSNNTGTGLGLVGSLVGAAAISQGSELEEQSSDPMMMSGGKRGRGGPGGPGGPGGLAGGSAEYIIRFLEMLNTIKIYHWSTLSYPTHKATDELHEKMSELVDSFIEKYIGHLSRRSEGGSSTTGVPVFKKGAAAVVGFCECKSLEIFCRKLDEYISYMEGLTKRLDGYTDLVNIRDEMVGGVAQALYLLRLAGGTAPQRRERCSINQ